MSFLGIGPLELIVIFVIILVVLGPKDMVKTGKNIGTSIRKVTTSDTWKVLTQARQELTTLPNKLAREAGIEEMQKEIKEMKSMTDDLNLNKIGNPLDSWTKEPSDSAKKEKENNPAKMKAENTEKKVVEEDNS